MRATDHDVAVVGGGPVGAALATALGVAGLSVAVLDAAGPPAEPETAPAAGLGFDLRTVALAPGVTAWLGSLGIWDARSEAAACSYERMEVWDAEGTGRIAFDARDCGAERLGCIVESRVLLAACWRTLAACGAVTTYAPERVRALARDGERLRIELAESGVLRVRLVVGADGARSRVREWAGIGVDDRDTGQTAVATVARTEGPHAGCARQRFLPGGPLALLPLGDRDGHHHVSVVWSMPHAQAARAQALDDDAFAAALAGASERVLGEVVAVDRRVAFPLAEQHARRYVAPGIALVGDAAHVVHPLAGQGVNLGLRDARALAGTLARARRVAGSAAIVGDAGLLARYERARRGENAAMLEALAGLRRLFAAERAEVRWLRNAGLRLVDGFAPLKRRLARQAMGLG